MIPAAEQALRTIFRIQAQGLGNIVFLCLFSLWIGSLLLSVPKGSQRSFLIHLGFAVVGWHIAWALAMVLSGPAATVIAAVRVYLFQLGLTFWLLMSVQELLSTERFQTIVLLSVILDSLTLLAFLLSPFHDLVPITSEGVDFQTGLIQFLLLVNIGKLFAGVLAVLTTWRFRRLLLQLGAISLELFLSILIVVRMSSHSLVIHQAAGSGIWLSLMLLIEISFRSGAMVKNSSALHIFERMERIAVLLSPTGKPSYFSSGAARRREVMDTLTLEEVRGALTKGWQQLDLRPKGGVYRWQSYDLHGGYLLYFEDIEDRLRALTQRDQLLEELQKKKNLLLQRGSMNRELEQFQMRLNILQRVENSISQSLRELAEKIEALDESDISQAQVNEILLLCTYIRRRSTLAVAELREITLDAALVRQWCEEILQTGSSQIHLEIPVSFSFDYVTARRLQEHCVHLARLTASHSLWVYGVLRNDRSLSFTLSGIEDEELKKEIRLGAPACWNISDDDEDLQIVADLEAEYA